MATAESSPVLLQHASPPHNLDSLASDVSLMPLASVPIEQYREEAAREEHIPEQSPPIEATPAAVEQTVTDAPMADTAVPIPVPAGSHGVQTTHSETAPSEPSEISAPAETTLTSTAEPSPAASPPEPTSTEQPPAAPSPPPAETTPTTIDEISATAPPVEPTPMQQSSADPPVPAAEDVSAPTDTIPTPADDSSTATSPPDPQPTEPDPAPSRAPRAESPEWVTWEDDNSTPSEDELKDVEGTEDNALDVPSIEKKVYEDVDDPEQRPAKKIRLNWVIKGVRGTKDRPNMARTMNSPCALVDGHYWQIKFFPRGNKSTSLSAYIRCTKHLPTPDSEVPESTFSYFEGPPDADMGTGAEPKKVLHVAATPVKEEKGSSPSQPDEPSTSKDGGDAPAAGSASDEPNEPTVAVSTANEEDTPSTEEAKVESTPDEDYRVSAQLGMVIYNPDEPRTCSFNSSEHQFTKHNDDWGWTNFVGPWNEIHTRQRGQRQPLLKNDTIAIDAYIRIFDDPSQALWWHVSHDHESIWPSKNLAGYFPMGTPPLYHSPAVAGITAWLLLAPFRKVMESVDAGKWRQDSQTKPRPLIARLQYVLHLMRHLTREDYVNVNPIIDTLRKSGETFNDVSSFWEVFRRGIELELDGETDTLNQLNEIFGTVVSASAMPKVSVRGVDDMQSALNATTLPKHFENSAPNFLPLMLEREVFDRQTCEWKLCHNRVTLNDEISLPNGEKYILYGFVVHVGVRNSGKFYSILRPNGLGTKWLAFEDGDGNKVFSYTRKRLQDYEGLLGEDLKNFKSTRQTAYMAMYIKQRSVESYLPGKLEEYRVPLWLSANLGDRPDDWPEQLSEQLDDADKGGIAVEVYGDEGIIGRQGLLDMFNVKQQELANGRFWTFKLSKDTTFKEFRQNLASQLEVENVEKLRLFVMSYGEVGQYLNAHWDPLLLSNKVGDQATFRRPLCLWLSLLKTEEDVKDFGVPDPIESKTEDEKPATDLEEGQTEANSVEVPTAISAPTSQDVAMGESTDAPEDTHAGSLSEPEANTATETSQALPESTPSEAILPADGAQQVVEAPSFPATAIEGVTSPPRSTDTAVTDSANTQASQPASETPTAIEVVAERNLMDNIAAMPSTAAERAPPVENPSSTEAVPGDPPALASESVVTDSLTVSASEPVMEASPAVPLTSEPVSEVIPTIPAFEPLIGDVPPAPASDRLVEDAQTVSASEPAPIVQEPTLDTSAAAAEMEVPEPTESIPETNTLETSEVALAESEAPAVEHGHLFDAVMSEAPPIPPPMDAAAVIQQTIVSIREAQSQAETQEAEVTTPEEPDIQTPSRPVPNVYGFLQVFKPDDQNFEVHSTFFAKRDASAKEIVRKNMGFDADKLFNAWHRETTLDGSSMDAKITFEDLNFSDGVDIIVGEILSDSKKEELRKEGKFTNPFALSRYLRMAERKHPIQARTTTEPVEIADFGMNYYKGPLVNGQPHGENCLMITSHGHTYEGPLIMNDKDGAKGKMTYQNGDVYEGEWKNDERHGQGTFSEKRTGNKYVGGFQNGKRWGKGVTHWQVADEEAHMCQICYGEEIDALFFDCGHVCSCVECAKQCDVCPICRKTVRQVVRMFWA